MSRLVIAVNGSPRKQWNTAHLLEKALEGARCAGAETELVQLYSLTFRGCTSCFACKRKEHYQDGVCAMRDGLTPLLERLQGAHALIIGSPIYFGDISGETRSFIERFMFSNFAYDQDRRTVIHNPLSVGFIYTMGLPEERLGPAGYDYLFQSHQNYLGLLGPKYEYLLHTDALQFDDYSKYHAPMFDEAQKKAAHARRFPVDCEKAFALGARLAE